MLEALTLDQLRIFVAIVEEGGFAAAGRALRRSQSVISYAVAQLEQTLEVALFDRAVKRRVQLTPQGQALLQDARRVLHEAQRLAQRATAMQEGLEPEVTLVIDAMFPTSALVALCAQFGAAFEQVRLRVFTEALGAVSARVLATPRAVGVQGPDGLDEAKVSATPLARVELVPVVAAGHALAALAQDTPDEALAQHVQLVLTDRSELTAHHQRGVLSPPERQWGIADLGTKRAFIEASLGWGNLPLHMVCDALASGQLVRLHPRAWAHLRWTLTLCAVTPRDAALGPAQRWIVRRLVELCPSYIQERA